MTGMPLMTPEAIQQLADRFTERWQHWLDRWSGDDEVVLYETSSRVLCDAVCAWAGVPLAPDDVERRTDEFLALIEGPASIGYRQWRGRRARSRSEAWLADLVERTRTDTLQPPADSALSVIAQHRDEQGNLLDAGMPERFAGEWDGSAFSLIPQGGGDPHTQHRCPGEWITIAVMKRAVQALVRDMHYDVPEQDLTIDKSDMPALPESGFVIRNVRKA
jgi:cytochrome P450